MRCHDKLSRKPGGALGGPERVGVMSKSQTCLFCTARPAKTREHVIPKVVSRWIRQIAQIRQIPLPTAERKRLFQVNPSVGQLRTTDIIDMQVAAVCSNCNSEFFNTIQRPCETVLRHAIVGDPVNLNLTVSVKQHLAAWTYKTALLVPLASYHRPEWEQIVGSLCHRFYWRRRPEVGARVWIARYDLSSSWPDLLCRAEVNELKVSRSGVLYTGTLVLLLLAHLLIVVVFWPRNAPDEIPGEDRRFLADRFIRLWPISPADEAWPPKEQVDYSRLQTLNTSPWLG